MLKDHVLVRKLVGIETSGSLNILFTDKTGTLTKGKLQVSTLVTGDGQQHTHPVTIRRKRELWERLHSPVHSIRKVCCPAGRAIGGNATDRALLEFAATARLDTGGYTLSQHIPFDSTHKFSAVRIDGARAMTLSKAHRKSCCLPAPSILMKPRAPPAIPGGAHLPMERNDHPRHAGAGTGNQRPTG